MGFFHRLSGQKFDPFRIYEVSTEHEVLHVTVLSGRNITQGRLADLADTPDPYVLLEVLNNPCGSRRTRSFHNDVNPTWNDTFSFVLDPTKDNVLRVRVTDEDLMTEDDVICERTFNVKKFPLSKTHRITLAFNEVSEVDLDVHRVEVKHGEFRKGLDLCPQEMEFVVKRREKVLQCLQNLLGKEDGPRSMEEVPTVAMMGSGGGFRAMVCLSGVFKALQASGVLDCVMYSCSLSGSAWYQGQLYSSPEVPLDELEEFMFQKLLQNGAFFRNVLRPDKFIRNTMRTMQKKLMGQPTSFTDIFGESLKDALLSNKPEVTLSSQRAAVDSAQLPLPLYAAVGVKESVPETVYHDYVEFTPFEVGIPKMGVFIPPELYGSKFYMGRVIQAFDEAPLSYLMGIWGSAYTAYLPQLIGVKEKVEVSIHAHEVEDELEPLADDLKEVQEEWKEEDKKLEKQWESEETENQDTEDKNTANKDTENDSTAAGREESVGNTNPKNSQLQIIKVNVQTRVRSIAELVMKSIMLSYETFNTKTKLAAAVHNVMHGIKAKKVYPYRTIVNSGSDFGEIFEPTPSEPDHQFVIDAGLVMNSPYPLLLRQQRNVDIILSFDFSARKKEDFYLMKELNKAQTWAKVHRIPFPKIDEQKTMAEIGVRECYVFENQENPNSPIILHFPLVNMNFRKYSAPGIERTTKEELDFGNYNLFEDEKGTFGTLNSKFDRTKFDRLTKLMEFNVLNNVEMIRSVLRQVVKRKQEAMRREEMTPLDHLTDARIKLGGAMSGLAEDLRKRIDALFKSNE